jgi:hypothetical protein
MKKAIHYYFHASVSKDWADVRVRHVATGALINSQDR